MYPSVRGNVIRLDFRFQRVPKPPDSNVSHEPSHLTNFPDWDCRAERKMPRIALNRFDHKFIWIWMLLLQMCGPEAGFDLVHPGELHGCWNKWIVLDLMQLSFGN